MTEHEYEGLAFNDVFPNGRSPGKIFVSSSQIRFVAAASSITESTSPLSEEAASTEFSLDLDSAPRTTKLQKTVTFPLDSCCLKHGGAGNRLIFFTHSNFPQWTFYTSDRSIVNDRYIASSHNLGRAASKAKLSRAAGWALIFLVSALIVAVPTLMIVKMDVVSALVAEQIPESMERDLGTKAWEQVSKDQRLITDEKANQMLQQIIAPLLEAAKDSRFEFNAHIIEDESLNAFALPGGTIAFHSGLILKADNRYELLGVLGHELSHVKQRHGIRGIIGTAGYFVVIQAFLGDISGIAAVVINAAPLLLSRSYSRDFETEADVEGLELLRKAKLPLHGMLSFFAKLEEQQKTQLAELDDETRSYIEQALGFLSTHPATEERIENLTLRIGVENISHKSESTEDELFIQLKQRLAELTQPQGS